MLKRAPAGQDVARTPFAAWDLEATSWVNFRCATYVQDDGSHEVFYSKEALAEFLKAQRRRCYAHYAGHYDFFFLPPAQQIILSGSGILKAQLGAAQLYDSWFTFQMSLKKLGKAIQKEKWEDKSDRIEELSMEETVAHCLNDSEVLAEALRQQRAWVATFPHPSPRWPPTSGSTAVYLLEAIEPEHKRYLEREVLSVDEWVDHSEAVTGGRVEVHQLGTPDTRVYTYDFNSSYPMSWCEALLPMGPWVAVARESPTHPGVYLCHVRQRTDHFPVVAPDHMWRFAGEAWCTSEELAVLRETGAQVKVIRGYVSKSVGPLGQTFIRKMYEAKLAGSPWAKLTINAPHGKLCQQLFQTSYFLGRDKRYVADRELGLPAWYQRPLIGAFILARARLRLWRIMEALAAAGWEVYYCDTDCVHTNCPPESFPGQLSDTILGALKHETAPRGARRAVYVAPKVYALEFDDGTVKVVCKGFPLKRVSIQTLERAAKGETVPIRDDAGLDSFRTQSAWAPALRHLRRSLSARTGGKHRGTQGRLLYPDYRDGLRPPASGA